jgi:predicted RNA-binding Zn ribbon-like protein
VSASLVIMPGGEVRLEPAGTGPERLSSAVWGEVFLAQQNDTWRRLKLCRNAPCSSAFYDRSKNNSGVWHDVKVCGNAVNLRASRARRRAGGTPPGEGQPR